MRLAQSIDSVAWFGRGPHENYPDRHASADLGHWRLPLSSMHTLHFPSENGLRCDVQSLELGSRL